MAPVAHADSQPVAIERGEDVTIQPRVCTGPTPIFTLGTSKVDSRPTNVKSAYITGPGTLTYNKNISATVSAGTTTTASADIPLIVTKANASFSKSVTNSRSWSDGFSYSLTVPKGQRRAMRLFQASRSFTVKKETLVSPCSYKVVYTNQLVNLPLASRDDEWKLIP